ncbi:MAG: nitroreductase family protein [Akkermansiaceae bacterium]|nr:nitroreductase family protein [Akkermansiaceae bacterium]
MGLDVFHTMSTMRPMRRLKPDPVPQELIDQVLEAGGWAPNSQNTQPYRFVVVRDAESREFFGARYDVALRKGFAGREPAEDDRSPQARNIRRALAFGKEVKDAPVHLIVCGKRDWPFAVPTEDRVGTAPPSYGSVYPCVQNILLACRALGLGASLTTMHQMFEGELCERLGIPEDWGIVAVIPIGYPLGKFGPLTRRPSRELTFLDRWGAEP